MEIAVKEVTCVFFFSCLLLSVNGSKQGNAENTQDHTDLVTSVALTLLLMVRISQLCRGRIPKIPGFDTFSSQLRDGTYTSWLRDGTFTSWLRNAVRRANQKKMATSFLCFAIVMLFLRMLDVKTHSSDLAPQKKEFETAISTSRKEEKNALIDFIILPTESQNSANWLRLVMITFLIILELLNIDKSLRNQHCDEYITNAERVMHEQSKEFKRKETEQINREEIEQIKSLKEEISYYKEKVEKISLEATTVLFDKTLSSCEKLSNAMLNANFVDFQGVFKRDAIELLQTLSEQCESNKKRKHIAVISGSVTSVVGGGLSIVGSALMPATFGTSLGLLALGGLIGAIGTGVNIGFTFEKLSKDKKRIAMVQPALEDYISFNKSFFGAVLKIFAAVNIIETLKTWKNLRQNETFTFVKAKNEADFEQFTAMYDNTETACEKLECIEKYSDILVERLKMLIERIREEGYEDIQLKQWDTEFFEKIKACELEILQPILSAIQRCIYVDIRKQSFILFVQKMFNCNMPQSSGDKKPVGEIKIETGLSAVKSGLTAGHIFLPVIDITEDAASLGTRVTTMAAGVSAAGVILSTLGVGIDFAFIGHAIYRLVQDEPEEFSKRVRELATMMQNVNTYLQIQ